MNTLTNNEFLWLRQAFPYPFISFDQLTQLYRTICPRDRATVRNSYDSVSCVNTMTCAQLEGKCRELAECAIIRDHVRLYQKAAGQTQTLMYVRHLFPLELSYFHAFQCSWKLDRALGRPASPLTLILQKGLRRIEQEKLALRPFAATLGIAL